MEQHSGYASSEPRIACADTGIGGSSLQQLSYPPTNKSIQLAVLFALIILVLFFFTGYLIYKDRYLLINRMRQFYQGARNFRDFRGVNRRVLNSLPVIIYVTDGDEEAAECVICLGEFEEGENLRRLPRCGHRFHIECINRWFNTRSTCPICRRPCRCVVEPADCP